MTDEEFREGLEDIAKLAREVHAYAKTAWPIIGHRPRIFGIDHATSLQDKGKELWLNVWTYSGESPRFLCTEYSAYRWFEHFVTGLDYRPPHSSLDNLLEGTLLFRQARESERAVVLRDLKDGLAKLFAYIQAECKRGFAECWGSVDAERRWDAYDQDFVERFNNKRFLEIFLKTMRANAQSIHSHTNCLISLQGGCFDRSNPVNHRLESTGSIIVNLAQMCRKFTELAERVNEETKERKLFVE